jgi:uncharacterized membrane protein
MTFLSLSIWPFGMYSSVTVILFNFFSVIGFIIALLIVQHELGYDNAVTTTLCSLGNNTDCDAVLKSSKSNLFRWFKWSDGAIIYFSGTLFLIVTMTFSSEINAYQHLFFILSICGIPITFLSIYYQLKIVTKWCVLCLLVVGVLWCNFGILSSSTKYLSVKGVSMSLSVFAMLVFSAIGILWFNIVKPILKEYKASEVEFYDALKFKRNINFFLAILQSQQKIDTTPFENELQIANSNADLQIIVACNPFCMPCAKTHTILNEWSQKFEADMGISIRFAINCEIDSEHTRAVRNLLQLVVSKKFETDENRGKSSFVRNILHDWYLTMDIQKFANNYKIENHCLVHNDLKQHSRWYSESAIEFTPTLFINGYRVPLEYTITDIEDLIIRLLQRNFSQSTSNEIAA